MPWNTASEDDSRFSCGSPSAMLWLYALWSKHALGRQATLPKTGEHRQGLGVSKPGFELRSRHQSPLSAAGRCTPLGAGHLERTGMTRISGPEQLRIKPLVPPVIPPAAETSALCCRSSRVIPRRAQRLHTGGADSGASWP